MKKLGICIVIGLIFMLLVTTSTYACWGFRPMAMGGVYSAEADDANAAYWNAAGLAQLDESIKTGEIVFTSNFYNMDGWFKREERLANPYYDSLNFAMRLGEKAGLGLAYSNSADSYLLRPGLGIKLFADFSIGAAIDYWRQDGDYGYYGFPHVKQEFEIWQLNLDALWKINELISLGCHIENAWRFDGQSKISDEVTGDVLETDLSEDFMENPNVRPAFAIHPIDDLTIVAGMYDALDEAETRAYSAGIEYKLMDKKLALRAGAYNLAQDKQGMWTFGFGYRLNPNLEIGYWGGIWRKATDFDKWEHNIGLAYRF